MRLRTSALALLTLATAGLPAAWAQSCQVRPATLQGSYVGDCIAGMASGKGRAVGTDRYEGSFRDGWPTGYGVYTFADGRRFEGEFLDGKVHGRARFSYTNGDVLEGVFKDNALTGTGRMLRANGESLLVQVQNGAMVVLGPAQAAAPTAPAQASPGAPAPAPAAAPPAATTPAPSAAAPAPGQWAARLDFEDLFPSYIFATATRKPPQAATGAASRSAQPPRADPLALLEPAAFLRPGVDPNASRSRYIGNAGNATYLGDPWGLVGIRFNNAAAGTQVTLRVSIDEVAEPTEASFTLPTPGEYMLYPRMRYRYDKLRTVSQPMPVNVNWSVEVNGRPAGSSSSVARVRSLQDAPLAIQTARGAERLLWVFAGFVTEDAAWIDEIIRDAFAGAQDGALGYQVKPERVDQQVAAVYQLLRKRGVKYSSITTTSGESDRVASQIVRFPSDSIRTSQANCVDGTVLMASVLRKMGIEPIIVTGPGHALLGYFRSAPGSTKDPDVAFVETTMIGSADFPAALKQGMAQVNEWLEKASKDPRFQFIPVVTARREGVMPIPR